MDSNEIDLDALLDDAFTEINKCNQQCLGLIRPDTVTRILEPLANGLATRDFVMFTQICHLFYDYQNEHSHQYWTSRCITDFGLTGLVYLEATPKERYKTRFCMFDCLLCQNRFNCPCTCIARRSKLLLRIGHLSTERTEADDSFSQWYGFATARRLLAQLFDVKYAHEMTICPALTSACDILIINMTMARKALDKDEVEELQKFIANGGCAILNCFSNYDQSGDLAKTIVGWLGIDPIPGSSFGRDTKYIVDAPGPESDKDLVLLLDGPFSSVRTIRNQGETQYTITPRAKTLGAISITPRHTFYPSMTNPSRKGRVIVSSNFHWFCDPGAWNGGLVNSENNFAFFANFCALALLKEKN